MVLKVPRGQKHIIWALENGIFSTFSKFFSNEDEAVFFGKLGKAFKKLFEYKVSHKKYFKKWFSNYLEVKNRSKQFSGSAGQNIQNSFNWNLLIGTILENDFHRIFWELEHGRVTMFTVISGKARQSNG